MKSSVKRRHGYTLVEVLAVTGVVLLMGALLLPAVQNARESARRMSCKSNLKQIGLALHNYHDTHGTFPPGWIGVDSQGRPEVSGPSGWAWGSMVLPFLEQSPLTHRLNYRSAVSDSDNELARETAISTFVCPSDSSNGELWEVKSFQQDVIAHLPSANYVGSFGMHDPMICQQFAGMGVQCAPEFGSGIFYHNSSVRFGDILDGATNVLMVGERKTNTEASPEWHSTWLGVISEGTASYPRIVAGSDITPNDQEGKLSNFSSSHGNVSQFVFADGRVRAIPNDISGNVFRLISSTTATTEIVSAGETFVGQSVWEIGGATPKIVDGTPVIEDNLNTGVSSVGMVGASGVGNFCSGTLIADNAVLTAAHCVNSLGGQFPNDVPNFGGQFTVEYENCQDDLAGVETCTEESKVLAGGLIFVHPGWSGFPSPDFGTDDANDIAIMFLQESIMDVTGGTVYIPPARINGMSLDVTLTFDEDASKDMIGEATLPDIDNNPPAVTIPQVGDVLTLVGFGGGGTGATGHTGDFGTRREGTTPIDFISTTLIGWDFESTVPPESNTAPGDSGGPAFGPDGTIWGVTSGGTGNAGFGSSSIDTRVDAYLDWIDAVFDGEVSSGGAPPGFGVALSDTTPFF